jgi:hypothetical protein
MVGDGQMKPLFESGDRAPKGDSLAREARHDLHVQAKKKGAGGGNMASPAKERAAAGTAALQRGKNWGGWVDHVVGVEGSALIPQSGGILSWGKPCFHHVRLPGE